MASSHGHTDATGLHEGSEQLLLLLAQGVCDEEGQGVEAGREVLQLGFQAANLLL